MKTQVEIRVCMGPGGIATGGGDVLKAFRKELSKAGVKAKLARGCSLHQVGCMGLCAKDVLVEVIKDGKTTTYQHIKPDMAEKIVAEDILRGKPVAQWLVDEEFARFYGKQTKVVLSDCGKIDPEDIRSYISVGGYEAMEKVLASMSPEEAIALIEESGLRGRGGAGFPTGLKWKICRVTPSERKYIICNADEGDPGAFMDRAVLEGNPHSVIEGMVIGAYAIGADTGYVYIRAEYPLAVERLGLAIEQARKKNFLGRDIMKSGFSFDVKLKLGAGAFVCGEETALIASIEGQRGMPRAKPPFPVHSGLWGKPTVINNVETLANVSSIVRNGARWFSSFGTEKSRGTKVFALTGKVKNTGLIEVPMGIPLREIIFDIGGGMENAKTFKAVQTGGPSGGCIPASLADISVDYESLASVGSIVGSGGMIVLDEDDCMVNVAKYFLEFTMRESCGKCVPCRVGTKRLHEILERITRGRGAEGDLALLEKLGADVRQASLCGLGQTAPNPVLSTLRYFRDEYEAHIAGRCPARVCRDLLTYSVIEDMCKGCMACLRACPSGAITGAKKKPHRINQELCTRCGACFDACKFKSINRE